MMKILAFTSIRSDYDLMSPLYKRLNSDNSINFKLIVSGAHLSSAYGYSIQQIEKDAFDILFKTETLISSDTRSSRVKSAAMLLLSVTEVVEKFDPDVMIYAGDREDVLMYAILGGYLGIPTIHFFSGDHVKDGYIDNAVRHATSKLSTFHFVTLEQHKLRLIRMGEEPRRIFTIGNIALDRFLSYKPMNKAEIFHQLSIGYRENFALMIFHPITEEINHVATIFKNILVALLDNNIFTFVSYPNTDPGNFKIIKIIKEYQDNQNFYFFKNLDRNIFLSIYKYSKFIIGNSSSGICEAASIPIPAINVGLRQIGRYTSYNVIFSGTSIEDIAQSISLVLTTKFQESMKNMKNPYGDGDSAERAYHLIKKLDFRPLVPKIEDPLDVFGEQ